MGASENFTPWPGRSRIERTYVLLDLGVSFCNPMWRQMTTDSGDVIEGVGAGHHDQNAWYVDLVRVTTQEGGYVVRDLFIDLIVPGDGRHARMLDLDEFADAIETGQLDLSEAVDGLRRWQEFLDRHILSGREATDGWTDFPPASAEALVRVPEPIGEVVRL